MMPQTTKEGDGKTFPKKGQTVRCYDLSASSPTSS